jgi:hypothetical protein
MNNLTFFFCIVSYFLSVLLPSSQLERQLVDEHLPTQVGNIVAGYLPIRSLKWYVTLQADTNKTMIRDLWPGRMSEQHNPVCGFAGSPSSSLFDGELECIDERWACPHVWTFLVYERRLRPGKFPKRLFKLPTPQCLRLAFKNIALREYEEWRLDNVMKPFHFLGGTPVGTQQLHSWLTTREETEFIHWKNKTFENDLRTYSEIVEDVTYEDMK